MEILSFTNALQLAIYLATPVLVAVLCAGIVAGILQTVTQVSDESISIGMRFAAAALACFLFSQFIISELQNFAIYSWQLG